MSIITGFLTTPTGSINNTPNQDLGSIFVAQNSSNNFNFDYTFDMSGNPGVTFKACPTNITFNYTGKYLLCITANSLESGSVNIYPYYLSLCYPTPIVYDSQNANENILFATPMINANDSNQFNGIPTSYTTIFNATQGINYGLYCFNTGPDSGIQINVTLNAIFLSP